jgi:hypothetical protein
MNEGFFETTDRTKAEGASESEEKKGNQGR